MEKFRISVSSKANKDLEKLYKSGKKSDIRKVENIFVELESSPRKGVGKPEQLKYYDGEVWSRRINQKDRFIYEIFDEEIVITVIQVSGHYDEK